MKKSIASFIIGFMLSPAYAFADEPVTPAWCTAEAARMLKSQEGYQRDIDSSQQSATQEPPPAACLGGKLQWELHNMSLNIPQFKAKSREWILKVPETKMTTRSFTIARAETKCKDTVVGYTPDANCTWRGCSPRMRPIITTLCWVEPHSHDVKFDIPSVTMRDRKFSVSFPEVSVKKQNYSYKYPRFYANEGCIGGGCAKVCEDITQRRVSEQQLAFEQRTGDSKREMSEATAANFGCLSSQMQLERTKLGDEFENWIRVATATRDAMMQQGLVAEAAGQTKVVLAMQAERDKALADFDLNIAQIAEEQRKATLGVVQTIGEVLTSATP